MTYAPAESKPGAPLTPKNTLAAFSFALGFAGIVIALAAVAAIVCGHISLAQIGRDGSGGRKLALTGTILGYVFVALHIALTIAVFAVFALVRLAHAH